MGRERKRKGNGANGMVFGELVYVPPRSLKPRAMNTKIHSPNQLNQIVRSINRLGFLDPVDVDRDGVILAGHGRVEAAKRIGLETIPVIYHDISGDEADLYAIAHNDLTLRTGMDIDTAVEGLVSAGADMFEAAVAGVDSREWRMVVEDDIEGGVEDTVPSIETEDSPTAPEVAKPRAIEMKIMTKAEEKALQDFLAWTKTRFPSARTTADRMLAYVKLAKGKGLV